MLYVLAEKDFEQLAEYTDASGRDIKVLVQKASSGGIWRPCNDSDQLVAKRIKFEEVPKGKISLPAVTMKNFMWVMEKASVSCVLKSMLEEFKQWTDRYGEDGD
eukprot:scaffold1310_cov24-Cyclotella_meneghiniana.AAC.3